MDTLLLGCSYGADRRPDDITGQPLAGRRLAARTGGSLLCAQSSIPPAPGSAGHCGHPGLGVLGGKHRPGRASRGPPAPPNPPLSLQLRRVWPDLSPWSSEVGQTGENRPEALHVTLWPKNLIQPGLVEWLAGQAGLL